MLFGGGVGVNKVYYRQCDIMVNSEAQRGGQLLTTTVVQSNSFF